MFSLFSDSCSFGGIDHDYTPNNNGYNNDKIKSYDNVILMRMRKVKNKKNATQCSYFFSKCLFYLIEKNKKFRHTFSVK